MITINKERLFKDINYLTSISPARNYSNIGSLNSAAEYIFKEFRKVTDRVEYQKFYVDSIEYKNIIASFGPDYGVRIIIGAHYDVCGNQPGADDNASGVAGLLEIARLLAENQSALKYRIDIVAYTLEEPPFFSSKHMGSYIHASSLKNAGVKIKEMICLEMLGYFSVQKHSQEYPLNLLRLFYPDKGNFIAIVGKLGQGKLVRKVKHYMKRNIRIKVCTLIAPEWIPGIDFSDHLNYWKMGYKAVMITDTGFYRNTNYHCNTDTIDTLDFDKMAEVVKGIYMTVVTLAQ
ncbi:MAG: M28 family peptidase [Bacteroidia bacterium]|nr:M28 family peptidase [Bacteroidia bacterium]